MKGVLGMLPGVGKIKGQLEAAGLDDKILTRQEAIIQSMTKVERSDPDVINGSRRKRIAAGAGVDVSEVNKLMKMHRQMADMMKKMGKGGRMPMMPGKGDDRMPGGLPPGMFPRRGNHTHNNTKKKPKNNKKKKKNTPKPPDTHRHQVA